MPASTSCRRANCATTAPTRCWRPASRCGTAGTRTRWCATRRPASCRDPAKVHYANYEGRWIKTRGPLSIPRSPQGHPVIMQAGSSDRGRDFAARWAEVIFTVQRGEEEMREFYTDIKTRMQARGRDPARMRHPARRLAWCWARPSRSPASAPTISNSLIDPELSRRRVVQQPRRRSHQARCRQVARRAAGQPGHAGHRRTCWNSA